MATDELWITVASILAAFNITKAIGDTGKGIEPTSKDLSGVSRYADVSHVSQQTIIPETACNFPSSPASSQDPSGPRN